MIKIHKTKNKYLCKDGFFIRDFTDSSKIPLDLNKFNSNLDNDLFVTNEFENFSQRYQNIDNENININTIVIVSDGYDFAKRHAILSKLDKNNVKILAVNSALKKWTLVGEQAEEKRAINFYVVNNPYNDCMVFLPNKHRYYPHCIASSRTNPEFLKSYRGNKYIYTPVEDDNYSGIDRGAEYKIDDYRSPICAAIALSWHFRANKIVLFCCDDSFNDERAGATKLENNLWCYPQQLISQNIVDGMCYWLKTKKIEIGDYSSGRKLEHATYIENEEQLLRYIQDE